MRAIQTRITYEMLSELLREAVWLPREANVVGTSSDWGGYPETLVIYIEHPDFDELGEGEMAPPICSSQF